MNTSKGQPSPAPLPDENEDTVRLTPWMIVVGGLALVVGILAGLLMSTKAMID